MDEIYQKKTTKDLAKQYVIQQMNETWYGAIEYLIDNSKSVVNYLEYINIFNEIKYYFNPMHSMHEKIIIIFADRQLKYENNIHNYFDELIQR